MKQTFFFFCIFILSTSCFAQDTIMKYNGDMIRAKISEVTPTEIKFKKFDFIDGPTYIEKKSDIAFIKYSNGLKELFEKPVAKTPEPNNINLNRDDYRGDYRGEAPKNNRIEVFGSRYTYKNNMIGENEVSDILMGTKDKRIMGLVQNSKQAKGLQYIGFGAIPLGIAAIYCLAYSEQTTYNPNNGTTTPIPNKSTYQTLAGVCLIAAVACPISSGIFKHNRGMYMREAVSLYNQKY